MPGRKVYSRSSRAKGKYIWTVVFLEAFNVPATPVGADICIGTDFAAHSGREGCTLMAIRGWLSFCAQAGTGQDVLSAFIAVVDEDESSVGASLDPALVGTYTDEDILWTGGFSKGPATTDVGFGPTFTEQINIKARRKIHTGQEVRLQLTTMNDEIQASGILRALLKVA